MPRFFLPEIPSGDSVLLTGDDANHISRSLRMTVGDALTLCDGHGTDYQGEITEITARDVRVQLRSSAPSTGEPDVRVVLFQGLPKGDKMELIVQKSVELGVSEIVPFHAARSVSRPDGASAAKKAVRWQKVADEAAGQSQRGALPVVRTPVSFKEALQCAAGCDCVFLCYEGGGTALRGLLDRKPASVAVFIGPEGGFAPEEVAAAEAAGAVRITLGPRILRTETAPLAALSVIMFATGNM
ncbi:MAG: 16S rRNA (uracil(1498)-N(3))-methyltransferase [Clostridia bacterium]|nr:16S rRNA (uracil(1498)-N(3))-methyltransferase [Clostridia bacterium]